MRTPGYLLILLMIASLNIPRVSAQDLSLSPMMSHLEWNIIHLLILADTTSGLTLWAIPKDPGAVKPPTGFAGRYDPVQVVQWLSLAKAVVNAPRVTRDSGRYLYTPPLFDRDSGQLVLYRERIGSNWGKQSYLLFNSRDDRHPFKVPMNDQQVSEFMTVFGTQAGRSSLSSTLDSTDVRVYSRSAIEESVDPPKLLSGLDLEYPRNLRGKGGQVLATFIIMPNGRMNPASFMTMLSDHPGFTLAAYEGLREALYRPLVVDGVPTAVRVCQWVSFRP